MNSLIIDWYKSQFEKDELWRAINPLATFEELKNNIPNVYDYIGVYDSIVRERIFSRLAELMNIDYREIYIEWLNQ